MSEARNSHESRDSGSSLGAYQFRVGERVRYIPGHAHGDRDHADCEDGIVRSFNSEGHPFVVYDNATRGKMLTLALAQPWTAACTHPSDLVPLSSSDAGANT